MSKQSEKEAIANIILPFKEAQQIASQHGWNNIIQPGLVKEMIIADILGHQVHKTKHEPDAFEYGNPEIGYEYLTCNNNKGSFQIDRFFKSPPAKKASSMARITRNKAIYCVIFDAKNSLDVLEIIEIDIDSFVIEVERQLSESSNDISHIGVPIKWARNNGKVVFVQS